MGKGGQQPPKQEDFLNVSAAGRSSRCGKPLITAEHATLVAAVLPKDRLPTKKQIRDSIPPECFEHSYVSAFAHVIRDTAVVAMFAFLAASLLRTSNMTIVDVLGWQAYAFFQGATLTGWWVLAHECGHGAAPASYLAFTLSTRVVFERGGRGWFIVRC